MSASEFDTEINQNSQTEPTISTGLTSRHLGMCKWFDKMKGFGFIQCLDAGPVQKDFFVHHSQLGTIFCNNKEQYRDEDTFRFLVAGEYVEFGVCEKMNMSENESLNDKTNERLMASSVTGPMGGPLMYQTQMQQQEELNEKYSNQNMFDNASLQSHHGFTKVVHRKKLQFGKGKGKGKGWGKGYGKGAGKGTGKGKYASWHNTRHSTDIEQQVHRNTRFSTQDGTTDVTTNTRDTNHNAYAALEENANNV